MKQKIKTAVIYFLIFILWTAAVRLVDVQSIGPMGSAVGFAAINGAFHQFTAVHWWLYQLTDILGLIPLGVMACFGIAGLWQWIRRKSILRVDGTILAMGVFYGMVLGLFLLFECFVVNYRPVLIDGVLEASYPSSTTLLVLCVMPTAAMALRRRVKGKWLRDVICWAMLAFAAAMVGARLFSGVHWLSDILGGCFLSAALVKAYEAALIKLK